MIDLALAAGRRRQSPRTGFIHLFHGDSVAKDTIPIYENGCFALTLFGTKKTELVLEGRDLLLRLLSFQSIEGNFPTYLHDYPHCYDSLLALKMGPILLRILQEYKLILNVETKEKIELALRRVLEFVRIRREQKPLAPLWEFRYQVLILNNPDRLDTSKFSPAELWEYWVSLQFLDTLSCNLVHHQLGVYVGPSYGEEQEEIESSPQHIEWKVAESLGSFTPRLLRDHVRQVELSIVKKVEAAPLLEQISGWSCSNTLESSFVAANQADSSMEYALRLLWQGTTLHSLVLPIGSYEFTSLSNKTFLIELPPLIEVSRNDLFEFALYVDASPETEILIEGKKGTVFPLGSQISIVTPLKIMQLELILTEGEAEFCGHIFRGNRPCQRSLNGSQEYAAFDWKIALRTLRRQCSCQLQLTIS